MSWIKHQFLDTLEVLASFFLVTAIAVLIPIGSLAAPGGACVLNNMGAGVLLQPLHSPLAVNLTEEPAAGLRSAPHKLRLKFQFATSFLGYPTKDDKYVFCRNNNQFEVDKNLVTTHSQNYWQLNEISRSSVRPYASFWLQSETMTLFLNGHSLKNPPDFVEITSKLGAEIPKLPIIRKRELLIDKRPIAELRLLLPVSGNVLAQAKRLAQEFENPSLHVYIDRRPEVGTFASKALSLIGKLQQSKGLYERPVSYSFIETDGPSQTQFGKWSALSGASFVTKASLKKRSEIFPHLELLVNSASRSFDRTSKILVLASGNLALKREPHSEYEVMSVKITPEIDETLKHSAGLTGSIFHDMYAVNTKVEQIPKAFDQFVDSIISGKEFDQLFEKAQQSMGFLTLRAKQESLTILFANVISLHDGIAESSLDKLDWIALPVSTVLNDSAGSVVKVP